MLKFAQKATSSILQNRQGTNTAHLTFSYDLVMAERSGNIFEKIWHKSRKICLTKIFNQLGLKPGEHSILDMGCNTGPLLLYFAKKDFLIEGIDFNQDFVEQAQAYLIEEKILPKFVQFGDATNTTFSNDQFDTVLMIDLLEHCLDEKKIALEAQRILKPGGYAIVAVPWCYHPVWNPWIKKILSGRSAQDIENHPDRFKTKENLLQLFQDFECIYLGLRVYGAWLVGIFRKYEC